MYWDMQGRQFGPGTFCGRIFFCYIRKNATELLQPVAPSGLNDTGMIS